MTGAWTDADTRAVVRAHLAAWQVTDVIRATRPGGPGLAAVRSQLVGMASGAYSREGRRQTTRAGIDATVRDPAGDRTGHVPWRVVFTLIRQAADAHPDAAARLLDLDAQHRDHLRSFVPCPAPRGGKGAREEWWRVHGDPHYARARELGAAIDAAITELWTPPAGDPQGPAGQLDLFDLLNTTST